MTPRKLPKDKVTFGWNCFGKPTPKRIRHMSKGFATFCTLGGTTLLANDYKLSGIIITLLGLFIDNVITPFFSTEADCPPDNCDINDTPKPENN